MGKILVNRKHRVDGRPSVWIVTRDLRSHPFRGTNIISSACDEPLAAAHLSPPAACPGLHQP